MATHRRLTTITLIAVLAAGCAASAQQPPIQKPALEAQSVPLSSIGDVIPVFVAIECTQACPTRIYVRRKDVVALNQAGQTVEALSFDDAVTAAGGAGKLSPVLTSTPDSAVIAKILGQSFLAGGQATGAAPAPGAGVGGALLGLLIGAAYSGYLASNPEALQALKLEPVVLPEEWGTNHGWVFFPKASYRELKITVMQRIEHGWSGFEDAPAEEIRLSWITAPPSTTEEVRYKTEHYGEVGVVELPPVEPLLPLRGGVAVGLARTVDTRTDPKLSATWQVGPKIADQVDALMANELATRGFEPVRLPPAPEQRVPQQTIAIRVLSAEYPRSPLALGWGTLARAGIEVRVLDGESGQVFFGTYNGEATGSAVSRLISSPGLNPNAFVGLAVSDAFADAVAKSFNDPDFTAAIAGKPGTTRVPTPP